MQSSSVFEHERGSEVSSRKNQPLRNVQVADKLLSRRPMTAG